MKKLVNSKVIDIDNIELFELGAEGLALQSSTTSKTSDGIDQDMNSPIIQRYIKLYDIFLKAMPYPLYAIESDIKYATLANFIKQSVKDTTEIWVSKGLFIKLDKETGMSLHLINNTWSIEYIKQIQEDNTDIELFKDSVGYKEYKWVLEKVSHRETTSSFYEEFMPKFIDACNNEPMVINWELKNILTFSSVPNRVSLISNAIIDIAEDCEYSFDIFCSGTAETQEKAMTWDFTGDDINYNFRNKVIRTYDFDSYVKKLTAGANEKNKMSKCNLIGLRNVFTQLCDIKITNEMNDFPEFSGIIYNNYIIFTVDKRLYVTKSNKITDVVDIAHGVEIYAADNGKVYFIKSKQIGSNVNKDIIYSYTLKNGAIRMCKTQFSN